MGVAKNKRRKNNYSFAGIPRIVMDSKSYLDLGNSAKVLLFEAAYRFKGKNNGDISFPWSQMRNRGFNSQATLSKAIHELIAADLIIKTREGLFQNPNNRCALYALTWQPIDECYGKDLELAPTTTPPRKFSLENG
jgi:hypothetical protein